MASPFQATGKNPAAKFTLKVHRGEGMALLAMNWKDGPPPDDFVGFAIEYREPDGDRWLVARNRLSFADAPNPNGLKSFPSTVSPIQKFRWVIFPYNADLPGDFTFRVTPVFMAPDGRLANGEAQTAAIELACETYPGQLNVAFTRGYVASQAFVDNYEKDGKISTLLPRSSKKGLDFEPTHPKAAEALAWMGFEARREIMKLLDEAIEDEGPVYVAAYDLSQADVVARLVKLGSRLRIIIDDSKEHAEPESGESQAEERLRAAGAVVRRQHMKNLQHNKMIIVDGKKIKKAVGGSTNFTWRGLFVQSNNAVIVTGEKAIQPFLQAFEHYDKDGADETFGSSDSAALWHQLDLDGIDVSITFSPHGRANATLAAVAADMGRAESSLLYSLAFLHQTQGHVRDQVKRVTDSPVFTYGISDKQTAIELESPDGNVRPVYFSRLSRNVPPPFKHEPDSGMGTNMHHKFAVIDFDKPSARVYTGSYNFSDPADLRNGENLLLIKDRRVATSYMVEALRIFDHYQFRVAQMVAAKAKTRLELKRPPSAPGETPWWSEHYTVAHRIRDRELFA